MNIPDNEFNTLAVCSFRYALGRMTYMPSLICEILTMNKEFLTPPTKELICREILDAIEHKRAGWDCDVSVWLTLYGMLHDGQSE